MSTSTLRPRSWAPRAYRYCRSHYRRRSAEYEELQIALNAAHVPVTSETYLARTAVWSIVFGLIGALVGLLLGAILATTGAIAAIDAPSTLSNVPAQLAEYELAGSMLVCASILGALAGIGYRQYRLYRPRWIASQRQQAIDLMLPHAILFMYALSHGGMNIVEVFRTLAASEDAYGEIAREFGVLTREMDTFNEDLLDALERARDRTPSDRLARFIDDSLSVIDSGGDFTALLETQSDTYLQEARAEQRSLIETLSLVAEGYVSLLIAGPLFLIIILMVIGLLGGNTILQVSAIVYLGIPLGSLLVIAVVDSIIGPLAGTTGEIDLERRQTIDPPESDDRAKRYLHRRRVGEIRDRLAAPFEPLIERPALTLLVTVPTALIGIGILVDTGIAELSLRWMTARPVVATSILFVLPFGLISLPLSVFHELRQRRIKTLTNRFPETLAAVSNVNKIGLSLPESLSIVGQRRTDRLGTELVRLKNDIDWNGDIADGLGRFANRLRVPVIARTTKLFIEANRAGGDLHRSLSIAADDATSQRQLRRERKQELTSYLAVAIVGFLVYVGVVVLIDQFYLQGITQTIESSDARPSDPGLARSFVSLDVNVFRLLVFQSALIQAVFSGLVAGKLSDNAVLSGLKFSIALVLVTVIVFLFI